MYESLVAVNTTFPAQDPPTPVAGNPIPQYIMSVEAAPWAKLVWTVSGVALVTSAVLDA